jgi:uncharacterized protein
VIRSLRRFLDTPQWKSQHRWRHALWRGMAGVGLTGLHILPVHGRWVQVHRRPMPMRGLHPDLIGLKIAQISDLHYSPVVLGGYLKQMMERVNRLHPDVVVVTGDLLTGGHQFIRGITRLLTHLKAREQVIVTFGNHDYTLAGKRNPSHGQHLSDRLERHLERHGLNVLRNERTTIHRGDGKLSIVGLDDEWTGRLKPLDAYRDLVADHPVICLNHNPVNAAELLDFPWEWMLAGHTHGRPLEEVRVKDRVVRRGRPFVAGYYEVAPGRHLYVNRGLSYGDHRRGTTNRPEITLFRLTRAETESPT